MPGGSCNVLAPVGAVESDKGGTCLVGGTNGDIWSLCTVDEDKSTFVARPFVQEQRTFGSTAPDGIYAMAADPE